MHKPSLFVLFGTKNTIAVDITPATCYTEGGGDRMENSIVITEIKQVILVGKEEYRDDRTAFRSTLPSHELICHFSGQNTILFDDLVLEERANTVRFLPKGKSKRYEVLRHEHGECIDVFFESQVPLSPVAFVTDVAQPEKVGALFKRLFTVWAGKGRGYYPEAMSLLYRILAELSRDSLVPKQHALRIKPALDAIHNHFLEKTPSVADLAATCGMGESYFRRLFKEKYGMSPKRYIIRLKIDYACELLQLGRYSVGQVAALAHFPDAYFFSRQFKEYVGLSPKEFAQKYRSSK